MSFLDIVVLSFLTLSSAGLLILNIRRLAETRNLPYFRPPLTTISSENPGKQTLISVVVPAKNEEDVIRTCLESLMKQTYPLLEILIVIDDGSLDGTRGIAESFASRDSRFKVIDAGPKPKDWVGKTWPCWRGYENSSGQVLFFTDADTVLNPDCLSYSVSYLMGSDYDVLSLAPLVMLRSFWANVIVPHLTLTINTFYPIRKVNSPKENVAYVFGSFFMITRGGYEKIGGHKSVRSEIVEDRALGQLAKSFGLKLRMEIGLDFSETLWETRLSSIWEGLQRVFSSPLRRRPWIGFPIATAGFALTLFPTATLILSASAILVGTVGYLTNSIFLVSCIDFLLLVLVLGTESRVVSRAKLRYSVFGFLGGTVFFSAMAAAAYKLIRGKGIPWRGAEYLQRETSIVT